jgi:hypothetical protein
MEWVAVGFTAIDANEFGNEAASRYNPSSNLPRACRPAIKVCASLMFSSGKVRDNRLDLSVICQPRHLAQGGFIGSRRGDRLLGNKGARRGTVLRDIVLGGGRIGTIRRMPIGRVSESVTGYTHHQVFVACAWFDRPCIVYQLRA